MRRRPRGLWNQGQTSEEKSCAPPQGGAGSQSSGVPKTRARDTSSSALGVGRVGGGPPWGWALTDNTGERLCHAGQRGKFAVSPVVWVKVAATTEGAEVVRGNTLPLVA